MASPKAAVRLSAIVVGVGYAAALHFSHVTLGVGWKAALSYLPSTLIVAVVAFDTWIWRVPGVRKLHRRPLLRGIWKLELTPDRDSHIPDGGNFGPIEGYIIIEQTFWSIAVTQYTKESESHSLAAVLIPRTESSRSVLSYTYDNLPQRRHLSRSPRHAGACELEVANLVPRQLGGTYYTDRFTAGDMSLELADRTVGHSGFDECRDYVAMRDQGGH